MYFARWCRTAVLPPSKRQKAQKPHSCAVFLLLKYFIFFRVQNTFLLEKNSSLFSKFFSTRGPTGFFDSLRGPQKSGPLPSEAFRKNPERPCLFQNSRCRRKKRCASPMIWLFVRFQRFFSALKTGRPPLDHRRTRTEEQRAVPVTARRFLAKRSAVAFSFCMRSRPGPPHRPAPSRSVPTTRCR